MIRYTLIALAALVPAGLSCSASLPNEVPAGSHSKIATEAEWTKRILGSGEKSVDLIEAGTIIASGLTGIEQPYEAIPKALDASIRSAKSRISNSSNAEEKIKILNEIVLPAIASALDGELSWLRDALASELGPCVPTCLLYVIAADAVVLPLELVCPPGHVYLRYSGEGKNVNIEVTDDGKPYTDAQYLLRLSQVPGVNTPLPEDMENAKHFFAAITRRQFAATLLTTRGSKRPPNACEKDLLTATRIAPDEPLAFRQLALLYTRAGNLELGEQYLTRTIELAPRWPALYQLRGILRGQRGNLKDGLEDIEAGISYAPKNASLHNARATVLGQMGKPKEAIEAYSQSLHLEPGQVDVLRKRAYLYQATSKEYAKAIVDLTEVIAKGKPGPWDYHARGVCQGQVGELDKGLDDLTKATLGSPDNAAIWRDRGITQAKLKRHTEAVEDFAKAITLDPSNASLYEFRARSYAILGDEARWDADMKKARELRTKPKE